MQLGRQGDEPGEGCARMESIYWVLNWACHRKCKHCYEDRFRPYVRGALEAVVRESEEAFPRIIDNLPDRMTYLDLASPDDASPDRYRERRGRIIMAGGEVLVDPVRTRVLYPVLEALNAKYRNAGGVDISIQTTGDLVTEEILEDLRERGIRMIAISGMDDYHVGMEGDKRKPLIENLHRMFDRTGYTEHRPGGGFGEWQKNDGPTYLFFGATDDSWIGKIWPRGRAWENGLSRATIQDNFCNAWSGGLGFLNHRYSGSEVSIDPTGDVFPCCLKTKAPIGNATEEKLTDILDSLVGHPAFEAINMGHPERMGVSMGWDTSKFYEKAETTDPTGKPYRNLCIGCDRFHEEVLAPVIEEIRQERLRAKGIVSGPLVAAG